MKHATGWITAAVAIAAAGIVNGRAVPAAPAPCDAAAAILLQDPRSVALCWLVRQYGSAQGQSGKPLRRVVSTDVLVAFGQPGGTHERRWLESLPPLGISETCSWRAAPACPVRDVLILRVGEPAAAPDGTTDSRIEILAAVTFTTEDWPMANGFYQAFRLTLVRSGTGWRLVDSVPGEAS